jgi:hypothetical protein
LAISPVGEAVRFFIQPEDMSIFIAAKDRGGADRGNNGHQQGAMIIELDALSYLILSVRLDERHSDTGRLRLGAADMLARR